jgi:RNA-directed DNA polymerase
VWLCPSGCRLTISYQTGSSIKKNADVHKEHQYLAKFDFQNFFTSIKSDDLVSHMDRNLTKVLTKSAIKDAARISSIQLKQAKNLCLSIGAPSSPLLSKSVMYEFDSLVSDRTYANFIRMVGFLSC